jgi:signal transduction histidine kinase
LTLYGRFIEVCKMSLSPSRLLTLRAKLLNMHHRFSSLTTSTDYLLTGRQKEAIVQKNRMTRILINNAGHEVRTPLNSIINYLEVALEDSLDERARLHLERSLQASKSLVFVVNDLLNLTEVEDSVYNMYQDYIDLKAMIRTVIIAFQAESSRKGLDVTLLADETIPSFVKSDPTSLRQVLSNLLANSIQHSEQGRIVIGLRYISTTDNYVQIEIYLQDEGCGLLESQLDSIFQDFEKILDDEEPANESLTLTNDAKFRDTNNTKIGLGLAVTARFVRLNNGQVVMSSAGPGKGTKVSVTIPFHKAAIQPKFPSPMTASLTQLPTPPTPSDPPSSVRTSFFSPDPPLSPTALTSPPTFSTSIPLDTPSLPSSPLSDNPYIVSDKLNILVAEDNPLNSRLLQTRLSRRGHGVHVAVDGQSCANTFKLSPELFDIILMDIQVSVPLCLYPLFD